VHLDTVERPLRRNRNLAVTLKLALIASEPRSGTRQELRRKDLEPSIVRVLVHDRNLIRSELDAKVRCFQARSFAFDLGASVAIPSAR